MTDDSDAAQTPAAPVTAPDDLSAGPSVEPEAPPGRKGGLPSWIPYLLVAVVPALIVGIAVYVLVGGSGGTTGGGVVDGLFRLGSNSEDDVISYGRLPPGYPEDLPQYPGAELLSAHFVPTAQGGVYFAFYSTDDDVVSVTSFFEEELDRDPWQLDSSRRSYTAGGVAFNRPADIDVAGSISVRHSDVDDTTSIIVQFQDLGAVAADIITDEAFELPESIDLPPGFPEDISVYEDSGGIAATVIDAVFQRSPQNTTFFISFLTTDRESDVIDSYRAEFEGRGWTVTNADLPVTSLALGIEFTDSREALQGQITADTYDEDSDYTRVDLVVLVDPQRGSGN